MGFPQKSAPQAFVSFALFGLGLLLAGCDVERYPEELTYPLRSDAIVTDGAISDLNQKYLPQRFDRPGQFAVVFGNLTPEQQATIINPLKKENKIVEPAQLTREQRSELETRLFEFFGTPAHPKAGGIDDATRAALKLDEAILAQGSGLFRQHCLHCHGLTGDGRGPTGPWVNPHPRDYRRGMFKFTSSAENYGASRKARREDLLRTLKTGIEGTSMPSFRLLSDEELEALVSYVIHLSLRGETEFQWTNAAVTGGEDSVEEWVQVLGKRWMDTEKKKSEPGAFAFNDPEELRQSIHRGRNLFMQLSGQGCLGCHTNFGRQSTFKYDDWGTIVRPANLMLAQYRGGRRPLDLYWRIQGGVNGSAMPASTNLEPKQVWDLVNFVQILPYPQMLKKYGIDLD